MKNCFAALCLVALAGCANPYLDFYQSRVDAISNASFEPPSGPVSIYKVANVDRDLLALRKRGYVVIGHSSFQGGGRGATDANLRAVGERVGAQIIVVATNYLGSTTSSVPISTPSAATSYSTSTARAYGPAGMVTAYGSGTTTTYGTSTTYVPITIDRHSYTAVYLAKYKWRLGVTYAPLLDEDHRALESNSGAKVEMVVDGTPAFEADILPGDILLEIDGVRITDPDNLNKALQARPGGLTEFKIWRAGKVVGKGVRLQ